MKVVVLAPLFLAVALASAQARLGEELPQLVSRYGEPLPKTDKPAPNQFGTVEDTFQRNGFQINVVLLNGVSAEEAFKKLNDDSFTSQEVETLLADNAEGHAWQAPQKSGGQTRWMSDNGSIATLSGHTFKITSKTLLNTQAQVKQLNHAPSLEGF